MAIPKTVRYLTGFEYSALKHAAGLDIRFSDGGVIGDSPLQTIASLPR